MKRAKVVVLFKLHVTVVGAQGSNRKNKDVANGNNVRAHIPISVTVYL
jgi:hypothetical protein